MRIAIGSDHAGFRYKGRLVEALGVEGHEVADFGTGSDQPVDYPPVIRPVAEAVAAGRFDRGIVLGGSGNGEAMVANRVPGVRCSLCWSVESARLARAHNDANVLALGERLIAPEVLLPIVTTWLATPFEAGRHARRVGMIDEAAGVRRVWHGWTTPENADAYERLLRTEIFPGIAARAIPGYLGIELLRREAGDEVEFVTQMRFASLEAVRAFAGAEYEVAVVPPRARALLSRFDERSAHYEIRHGRGTA